VDTGQSLPKALFDKMLAAKNFQSGLQTIRQIEFALFDMLMHMEADSAKADPLAVSRAVHAEVGVLPRPAEVRTPNSFGHVFSGGYAAGYYSYKWAELLSADAYAAFEEAAASNGNAPAAQQETGRKYRREVLEAAAGQPPRALLRSEEERRSWTRCCAIKAWPDTIQAKAHMPDIFFLRSL
jgi:oligopeptidase A